MLPSIQASSMSSLKLNINGESRERGVQVVLKEQKKQMRDKRASVQVDKAIAKKARPEIVGASGDIQERKEGGLSVGICGEWVTESIIRLGLIRYSANPND